MTTAAAAFASEWPFARASAMPFAIAFSAARWSARVDRQLQRRQRLPVGAVLERADDAAARVDAQVRAREAAVQDAVVLGLDARTTPTVSPGFACA